MAKTMTHDSAQPRRDAFQPSEHANKSGAGLADGDSGLSVDAQQTRQQMQMLAWLMDESIPIPGLGFRVGLDGLLGLIPGIGDLISTGISTFIIRQASLLGVPKIVLLRMTFNTAIDLTIGAIPIIGDLFDLGWKSNKRNVRIVLNHLDNPTATHRFSWLSVLGMLAGIALAFIGIAVVLGALIAALIR